MEICKKIFKNPRDELKRRTNFVVILLLKMFTKDQKIWIIENFSPSEGLHQLRRLFISHYKPVNHKNVPLPHHFGRVVSNFKDTGSIPQHNHSGTETTLVLQGGFSDESGTYHAGDFITREAGEEHSPTAIAGGDCICLAVLESPLRFTRWHHRLLSPLLQLRAG